MINNLNESHFSFLQLLYDVKTVKDDSNLFGAMSLILLSRLLIDVMAKLIDNPHTLFFQVFL